MADRRTVHRVCTLCEAICGISVEVEGDQIVTIRGDREDPFSKGYICPKAYALKGVYEDPDRLRHPVRRTADGWEEITWEEAYATTAERLLAIREAHGPDALAWWRGNPTVHDLGALAYWPMFQRAMGRNYYSALTLDTAPRYVQVGLMFGGMLHIPVPDLDRTQYLLVFGANPMASNGSLMSAPDVRRRLRAIQERDGRVVVVDPRRSETAGMGTEHVFIRPGMDAGMLLAMVHTMFEEDLLSLGRCDGLVDHLDHLERAVANYSPEAMGPVCGVEPDTIRRLTREFCAADGAACYGRLGTCVQEFGTLASWGIELVNILSGNLDSPGGVMFTKPAADISGVVSSGKGVEFDRYRTRVRGYGELFGQFPAAALAEEIETPGQGQIRGMVFLAGNPVCSAPNADRLDEALASLEFMVAIDFYINETTRHADIILPPVSSLQRPSYDLGLYNLAVRDMAKWSPPVFPAAPDAQHSWQVLLTLGKHLMGMGEIALESVDAFVLQQYCEMAIKEDTPWHGLTPDEAIAKLGDTPGPERILDLLLRVGPYGDGFGRHADGLTLAKLQADEHGLDLGPLKSQLPEKLNTPNGRIDLMPERIVNDLPRFNAALAGHARGNSDLVLIGRRHIRTINSWLGNIPSVVKGPDLCTLQVSEADAQRLQLETGGLARVTSRVGTVIAPVEVTDEMMAGVVSLPHGWGHDRAGVRMAVAQAHAGVNSNILTDDEAFDVPSNSTVLNGIPVTVAAER